MRVGKRKLGVEGLEEHLKPREHERGQNDDGHDGHDEHNGRIDQGARDFPRASMSRSM